MREVLLPLLIGAALLCGCSGQSKELAVPPAREGLAQPDDTTWWSRAAIDAFMRYSVWRGSQSGYIAMFARDGVPVYSAVAGWKDIAAGVPMTINTPVRIASMTKPVTAVAAMQLVQEGKLKLDDPVAKFLPEFATLRVATSETPGADGTYSSRPANTVMRVRHLLMFSSGIGPGTNKNTALEKDWERQGIFQQPSGTLGDRVSALAQLPLFEEPGTRWRYGYSADVLARIVEVVSGESISAYAHARIFQPLGMSNTYYNGQRVGRDHPATVYTQDSAGDLVVAALTHEARDWMPGGSGLISTAPDYLRFALMLWNGGEYQGVRVLQTDTVDTMRRLHVPNGVLAEEDIKGMGWGLGMAVVADGEATLTSDRTGDFWWSGYLGTTFIVSPRTGLVGVVLSQNEPGEFSGLPMQIYIIQGLAFAGL